MGLERELLDVTDKTRRPLQHGAVLVGIVILLLAGAFANRPGGIPTALWMIAAGLLLFGVAGAIRQTWTVAYKGHAVRFVNNPFLGEKLFIDNALAGKGQIGFKSETRAVIATGEGAGDTIIVCTDAGLLTLRCRITAQPTAVASPVSPDVTDEQLLAEARRRGLR